MSQKILIYVQHILGIGHTKRIHLIAEKCHKLGLNVLICQGGFDHPSLRADHSFKIVQLPVIKAEDPTFKTYLDADHAPVSDSLKENRKSLLLKTYHQFKPDLILIESYPFGRSYFEFELLPLITVANQGQIPVFCSIRDIVVLKTQEKELKRIYKLNTYFNGLIIHGDPALIKFNESFSLANRIKIPLYYSGYVADSYLSEHHPYDILISKGGGKIGQELFDLCFKAALLKGAERYRWLFIGELPQHDSLPGHITVYPSVKKLINLLQDSQLLIGLGGYNTICDILKTKCNTLIIPFETKEETEQKQRAERLSSYDLIRYQTIDDIKEDPEAFLKTIEDAIETPLSLTHSVNLNGAEKTALILKNALTPEKNKSLRPKLSDILKRRPDLTFWIRDDDLNKNTAKFKDFITPFIETKSPILLAAIPQNIDRSLAEFLDPYPFIHIAQHGYNHKNHSQCGTKKIEYGGTVDPQTLIKHTLKGQRTLKRLFKDKFSNIFIPPWNRIEPVFQPMIREHYKGLSTFRDHSLHSEIPQQNAHLDFINWKSNKRFKTVQKILNEIDTLSKTTSTIGLLTHHLDHRKKDNKFLKELLMILKDENRLRPF